MHETITEMASDEHYNRARCIITEMASDEKVSASACGARGQKTKVRLLGFHGRGGLFGVIHGRGARLVVSLS